jgi:hypothetical protein
MALRHNPTPCMTPGCDNSGRTPARTSEDLPQPDGPRIISIAIKNEPFSQGGSGVGCGFAGALTG